MSVEQITKFIMNSNQQLIPLRNRAISGNTEVLNSFMKAFNNLLSNSAWHPNIYQQINEMCLSAQPQIIAELNNEVFPKVAQKHKQGDLDNYIIFWKRLLSGTGSRIEYPNVARTLSPIRLNSENRQLPTEFLKYQGQFETNMTTLQQKKVQFFEDFDDSFITESIDDQMNSEIIEMDIQQIKQIRSIVEHEPIQQLRAEEYLTKMHNFLGLRARSLSKQLNAQFNTQRIWAKQYVDNYRSYISNGSCYLNKYFSSYKQQGKKQRKSEQYQIKENKQPIHINNMDGNMSNMNIQLGTSQVYQNDQKSKLYKNKQKRNLNTQQKVNTKNNFATVTYEQPNRFTYNDKQQQKQKNNDIVQIQHDNYPIAQSSYTDNNIMKGTRKTLNLGQKQHSPNFKRSTQTYQNYESFGNDQYKNNQSQVRDSRNKKRSRIFEQKSQSRISKIQNEDFMITKHGKSKQQNQNRYDNHEKIQQQEQPQFRLTDKFSYQNNKNSANSIPNYTTPQSHKNKLNTYSQFNIGTPIQNKTGFSTSSKKLSQFAEEKRLRKLGAPLDNLAPIEDYVLKPYSQHFNQLSNFTRFRRNCLEDTFTLYASAFVVVNCTVFRQADSKLQLQITYSNQSNYQLAVEIIYRIPKCFRIEKNSKITKRFFLKNQIQHNFSLQMILFPLESCLLNLKYKIQEDLNNLKQQNAAIIPLPVTVRNFLQFLMISEEEWKKSWTKLIQTPNNFHITRHIILDKMVLNDDELSFGLKQFTHIGSVEGYSADEYGALCRHISYNKMVFLLRISIRVDNILTLEIVTDRKIDEQDEIDFLQYCLSVWGMLLCRIQDSSII